MVVRETTEWLTRHNTRYHLGHGKDSVWIERQSQSLLQLVEENDLVPYINGKDKI